MSCASSVSLVSVDSTRQHSAHMFDVSCRICTGADSNTGPSSSTVIQSSTTASLPCSLPNDDCSPGHVGTSDHSPRKKICLAQRLKVYSTELQKSSTSDGSMKTGDDCISEMDSNADVHVTMVSALSDVKQNDDVQKPMQLFEEPVLNKQKLNTDDLQWQMQTAQKLQKESSLEQKYVCTQKCEECSTLVDEEPSEGSKGILNDITQQVDHGSWESSSLQEDRNQEAAGYITV